MQPASPFTRAIVIVMDSVGVGELPDASAYGDEGSDTLGNIARRVPLELPTLRALGLGRVASIGGAPAPASPKAAVGRMAEASAGKDSVTGHWEMMGIVLARPFPLFPNGFSAELLDAFSLATGRGVLGVKAASLPVIAIGKIEDLFAGRGITRAIHTTSDDDGMDQVERQMEDVSRGLIFTNLVDFDTQYGHRNDVQGYAANLERFDRRLSRVLPRMRDDDLLVVTADHGNDPTTASTDHSREYVPLLVTGRRVRAGADLGTRETFADVAATLAELFGVTPPAAGSSFLRGVRA